MAPYAFALFVTLGLLFEFQLTSQEMSFEDDQAKAAAANFCAYRKGIIALISDGRVKTTDKSISESTLLSYLRTYRPNFEKMKNWKTVIKDGKCYLYVEPSEMPRNSGGAMEMHLLDMVESSAMVGHKSGGSLTRGKGTTTYTFRLPNEIPDKSVVSVISLGN